MPTRIFTKRSNWHRDKTPSAISRHGSKGNPTIGIHGFSVVQPVVRRPNFKFPAKASTKRCNDSINSSRHLCRRDGGVVQCTGMHISLEELYRTHDPCVVETHTPCFTTESNRQCYSSTRRNTLGQFAIGLVFFSILLLTAQL